MGSSAFCHYVRYVLDLVGTVKFDNLHSVHVSGTRMLRVYRPSRPREYDLKISLKVSNFSKTSSKGDQRGLVDEEIRR